MNFCLLNMFHISLRIIVFKVANCDIACSVLFTSMKPVFKPSFSSAQIGADVSSHGAKLSCTLSGN